MSAKLRVWAPSWAKSSIIGVMLSVLAFALTLAAARPAHAQQGSLDVESWLEKPGVKLVVVEFYANWCKPCMTAVPKWKALHDKYRKDGLRFVVVSTRDAGGVCANPGWTPDEVVCDDDGIIADRFEANPLPAAYLWDWQGHLLSTKSHVEEVETKIEEWMVKAPRVDVQADKVPAGTGIDTDGLRDAVRAELQRSDKMVVVATDAERVALRELVRRSLEMGRDEQTACEVGKEVSANSLVRAVITRGVRPWLQLKLLSAERGCLVAAGTTRWNPDKPGTAISEAVADLLGELRRPTQFPWGVTANIAGTPLQAEVRLNGEKVGSTPLQKKIAPGKLEIAVSEAGVSEAGKSRRRSVLESGGQVEVDLNEDAPTVAVTEARKGGGGSTLGWVTLGLGVAVGLGSGGAFALSANAANDADAATSVSTLEGAVGDGETFQTVGIVTAAGAGALIALGIILQVVDRESAASPTVGLTSDGQGALVGVGGRF